MAVTDVVKVRRQRCAGRLSTYKIPFPADVRSGYVAVFPVPSFCGASASTFYLPLVRRAGR